VKQPRRMTRKLHAVGLVAAMLAASARIDAAPPHPDAGDGDGDGDARDARDVNPPDANAPDAKDAQSAADIDDGERHIAVAAGWAAIKMAISGWYYWHTQDEQEVDWTHPSWKDKLTLRSVRFDTNAFHVNAIRHPLTGIGDYQIARSNGFGVVGSTVFAYLAGAIWELGVECYEDPSLNDLIMNGAGGLALGEPLYQIGQLWRGGELTAADRLRTAAFSPFAAVQDLWRTHRIWHRPRAWRDIALAAGPVEHRLPDGAFRNEVALGVDIDIVRHRGFVEPGAHDGAIAPGAWSRMVVGARLGDAGRGEEAVATSFRSRTSLAGRYRQDDAGRGELVALGTAFTYRRDRLATDWDRLALAHLLGPQLQLSRRGGLDLRWDVAGYVDVGMIDAHVFGPTSLPEPPPFLSTLQAQGYYNAAGVSFESRLRAERGAWQLDVELTAHQLWSLDFADRVQPVADRSRIAPERLSSGSEPLPAAPHGVSDLRVYGHAQLGVRGTRWGLAATADAALRRGDWQDLARTTGDWTFGVVATAHL
jgi:Domain of unknown function (DUF3943)